HGCSHVFRRNENVGSRRFWREKTVASLMNGHPASDQVSLSGQNVSVLSDTRDFAGLFELSQQLAECYFLSPWQPQLAGNVDLIQRPVVFPRQQTQNLLS